MLDIEQRAFISFTNMPVNMQDASKFLDVHKDLFLEVEVGVYFTEIYIICCFLFSFFFLRMPFFCHVTKNH